MKAVCLTFLLLIFCGAVAEAQPAKVAKLERQLARTKSEPLRLKRLIELASVEVELEPAKALWRSREAISLAESRRDTISLTRACHAAARATAYLGDYQTSIAFLERASAYPLQSQDSAGLFQTYGIFAFVYYAQGKPKQAADYCRLCEMYSGAVQDTAKLIGMILQSSAVTYELDLDIAGRLERARRAMRIAELFGKPSPLAEAHCELAKALWERGEYNAAFESFERSLYIYESLGQRMRIAAALMSVGSCKSQLSLFSESREYYKRAIRIYEQNGNVYGSALSQYNFAVDYLKENQHLEEALPYLESSLKSFQSLGMKDLTARVLVEMGSIYLRTGRLSQANEYYQRGLMITNASGDKRSTAKQLQSMAHNFSLVDQHAKAKELYLESLKINEKMGDDNLAAACRHGLAGVYANQGHFVEALELLKPSYEFYKKNGPNEFAATTAKMLGEIHYQMQQWDRALHWWKRSSELFENLGNPTSLGYALLRCGELYRRLNRAEQALSLIQRGLKLYEEGSPDKHKLAWALCCEGQVLILLNRSQEALPVLQRSMRIYYEVGDSTGAATAEYTVGVAYHRLDLFDEALICYYDVLKFYERNPNEQIVLALWHIGSLLSLLNRDEEALEYYYRARDMLVHYKTENALRILIESGIGNQQMKLQKLDEALATFNSAKEMSEREDDRKGLCTALASIGRVYMAQLRYSEARSFFAKSIAYGEQHNSLPEIGSAYKSLGMLLSTNGEHKEALEYFRKSLNISEQIRATQESLDVLKLMSESYLKLDQSDLAYDHLLRHSILKDSFFKENSAKVVFGLNAKYESERKDGEILMLAKEKALTELTLQQQNDRLAMQELELTRKQAAMTVQRLTAIRLRQQTSLLAREHEVQGLELARRTAERDAEQAQSDAVKARLQTVSKEKIYQSSIAAREQGLRNALLGGLGLVLVIGFLGVKRIQHKRVEASLRAEAAEFQAKVVEAQALVLSAEVERREKEAQRVFSQRLIDFQEQERKRLSSELHDSLSQDLIVIKNRVLMALDPGANPEQARSHLDEAVAMATTALSDVRQISRDLRPYQIDQIGLAATLRATLQKVAIASPVSFTIEIEDVDKLLAKDDEIKLYRLVQESVNNILKHAEATEASVRLHRSNGRIQLSVDDNGKGFNTGEIGMRFPAAAGLGLRSMTERVQMLNGTMNITSSPDIGTHIEISVPART
jgi:signal transduction histidine kinase